MRITELESYFQDETTLLKLIEEYQPLFDTIEEYETKLRNQAVDSPHEIELAMRVMVALYSKLNVVARVADVQETTQKVVAYNKNRLASARTGTSITATELQNLSAQQTSHYRRIKAIFEAYTDSCEKIISVLQSCLKSYDREKGYQQRA